MSKHTEGPWTSDCGIIRSSDGNVAMVCCWANSDKMNSLSTQQANARLIAAAPELLAALREAVEGCPCSLKERDSGHRTECRAPAWSEVLAKAEGRK